MSTDDQPRPTGPVAKEGIECLTFGTPNGHKATILLEELKEAYGIDYTWQAINIMDNIQKEEWFLKYSPNGRIPAIIDHDNSGFSVFEGAAILAYLARKYDTKHLFSFEYGSDDFSRAEQWIAWQHGGLGPMQGQANHFHRLAKERIAYPTQRYVGETERLWGILDKELADREYMIGPGKGMYSIADIANFSWCNWGYFAGVDVSKFPNVEAWLQRINARAGVQKGINIPKSPGSANDNYQKRLGEDKEFAGKEKELTDKTNEAKKQYDYKYSSP